MGILSGAYDMHVHTSPDVSDRKYNDLELAKRYVAAGLKGFVIKPHQFQTAARAAIVRSVYPDCRCYGGITLNHAVGGLNPSAVEMAARLGAKVVWFPTFSAKNQVEFLKKTGQKNAPGSGRTPSFQAAPISVLEDGKLSKAAQDVLDVIQYYGLILATGHISPAESLALFQRGKELGIRKMIATHPSFPVTQADVEMQKRYVEAGAFIEHCYYTPYYRYCSFEEIIAQVRAIGVGHVILSSDMGQAESPDPAEAFEDYAKIMMQKGGFSEEEIRRMICVNPESLLEG